MSKFLTGTSCWEGSMTHSSSPKRRGRSILPVSFDFEIQLIHFSVFFMGSERSITNILSFFTKKLLAKSVIFPNKDKWK